MAYTGTSVLGHHSGSVTLLLGPRWVSPKPKIISIAKNGIFVPLTVSSCYLLTGSVNQYEMVRLTTDEPYN